MDDYDRVRVGFPGDWNGGLGTMVTDMRKLGCDYFRVPPPVDSGGARAYTYPPYIFGINMCWGGNSVFFPIKPLSYWCPEACGCRSGEPLLPQHVPSAGLQQLGSLSILSADSRRGPDERGRLSDKLAGAVCSSVLAGPREKLYRS